MEEGTIRVMALHALAYCERLFFLEEVEQIRVADERVWAGRTLHEELGEDAEVVNLTLESEALGLRGRLDALRRRDGAVIPYEHKKGRSREGAPWDSDRLQLAAYALLLEEALGRPVAEGRIRYHADNALVRVPIDLAARAEVAAAVARARALSSSVERPPPTTNPNACAHCSLAPVCLPEESRLARGERDRVVRLHPKDDRRSVLHVTEHGTRVGRSGHELQVTPREGEVTKIPIRTVRSVSCHGHVSVSAQALQLCADHGIAVHWFGAGGWWVGSFQQEDDAVQRRIRQYEALREPGPRLHLARVLVAAKVESQLRYLLRASRGDPAVREAIAPAISTLRTTLPEVSRAERPASLLGAEGLAAAAYFRALPALITHPALRPDGRSRRPPADPCNALLSFGYGLVLREVQQAIRSVGLEPGFGFYHQPRSGAPPLALDLLELFRVACVDMAAVAALNRGRFDPVDDFTSTPGGTWLSAAGRKKAIAVFEDRLRDEWRHPVLGYSLSYRRHLELEVRLLEKEWCGEPGLFARARLR